MTSMHVHVSGAHYSLWGTNKIVSIMFNRGIYVFEQTGKPVQYSIGDFYCPGSYCSQQSCFSVHIWREMMKVVTNVFNAERAATFWFLLLRTKNQSLVVQWWWHIWLCQKGEPCFLKWKTISFFQETSAPITIKRTRIWARKGKNLSTYSKILSTLYWQTQLTKLQFQSHLFHFQ